MKKSLLLSLLWLLSYCSSPPAEEAIEYDVLVYGATSAGVIAAYSAAQMGKSVIIVEPTGHLGGLTSGGLGKTDIGNKYAITGLSRDFYRRLGDHYGTLEQWLFEPGVAKATYQQYLDKANIEVLYKTRLQEVAKEATKIKSATFQDAENPDATRSISARMFIDATYEGDLLAEAGVSYTIGREPNSRYNETYNGVQLLEGHQFPDNVDPYRVPGDPASGLLWGISPTSLAERGSGDTLVQAYNFRICLTDEPGNMIPVTRPENYDSTRYELLVRLFEAQPGREGLNDYFIWSMMPNRKTDINNRGGFSTDMINANHAYPEAHWEEREAIIKAHEDYTRGLLYFYNTDPRVPPALQAKMRRWGYPKDEYTENGNWSPQLYIREARRMIGEYVMTQANCVGEEVVEDPVGLAAYTMDSHNCQRIVVDGMVKNEGNVEIGGFPPYPIAYRSITPKREEVTNLLVPVCLSASHIAFGSIRMEPVFMVLGQVAGLAASMSIDKATSVQSIDLPALQDKLENDPLLDGSAPDVLADDEILTEADKQGTWETKERFGRSYKGYYTYSTSLDDNTSASFRPDIERAGSYDAYYFCTLLGEDTPATAAVVVHAGDQSDTLQIDYKAHLDDWAPLGNYRMSQGDYVEVIGKGAERPLVADAVLLVPKDL